MERVGRMCVCGEGGGVAGRGLSSRNMVTWKRGTTLDQKRIKEI